MRLKSVISILVFKLVGVLAFGQSSTIDQLTDATTISKSDQVWASDVSESGAAADVGMTLEQAVKPFAEDPGSNQWFDSAAWVTDLDVYTVSAADAVFATAAQGALADTATQPGDNVSTLTNDSGYLTSVDLGESVSATSYTIVVDDGIDLPVRVATDTFAGIVTADEHALINAALQPGDESVAAADITDATATGQAAITAAGPAALRDVAGAVGAESVHTDWYGLKKAAAAFAKMRYQRVAVAGMGDSNWVVNSYGWQSAWPLALANEFQIYGTGPITLNVGNPEGYPHRGVGASGGDNGGLSNYLHGSLLDNILASDNGGTGTGLDLRANGIHPNVTNGGGTYRAGTFSDSRIDADNIYPTTLAFNWDYYYLQFKDPLIDAADVDRIEYDSGSGETRYYLASTPDDLIDADGDPRLVAGVVTVAGAANASNNGTFPFSSADTPLSLPSNAATDDTNATTGAGSTGGSITSEAGTRTGGAGSYYLRYMSDAGGWGPIINSISPVDGTTYTVTFWMRASAGHTMSPASMRFTDGGFTNRSNTRSFTLSETWTQVSATFTISGSASQFYIQVTGGSVSEYLEIDDFSIVEEGIDEVRGNIIKDGAEYYVRTSTERLDATDDEATTSASLTLRYQNAVDGELTVDPMVRGRLGGGGADWTTYSTAAGGRDTNPLTAFNEVEGIGVIEGGTIAADSLRRSIDITDHFRISNPLSYGPRMSYAFEAEIPERKSGFSFTSPCFLGGLAWYEWRQMLAGDAGDYKPLDTYFWALRRNLNGEKNCIFIVHVSGNDVNDAARTTPIGYAANTKEGFYDHTLDTANAIRSSWKRAGGTDDTLHLLLFGPQDVPDANANSDDLFPEYRDAMKAVAAQLPNASTIILPNLIQNEAGYHADNIHMTQAGFDAHLTAIMAEITEAMVQLGDSE